MHRVPNPYFYYYLLISAISFCPRNTVLSVTYALFRLGVGSGIRLAFLYDDADGL